ncbi:MAG: BREX-1 system adenine-specific DNA-methyltransferase PglX [Gallionella sp.]|nr:BREX-1 system adenine-specific DNA-methyltransferase PglX [Gallionella sp.]
MNKAKLKSYAPQARKDFIAAVTARANLLGLSDNDGQLQIAPSQLQGDITLIAGQPWPAKVHGQRQQLIARLQKDGFAQTLEAVAYTWFNRMAALRFMDLHDYLGHGHRALSSAQGTLPDLLTHAADLAQSGSLPGLNAPQVFEMKLAGNRDGELYRMLLVSQCNALSRAMPFLFERIDDDSELLLPDNLLRSDSVIAKLVEAIPEEDWAEVEIIGWLYQFYISEKKDQVIGKVVKSEDIPAATQLFTPNWIVQYLVQNSVGRLWLMANPHSTLAKEWPYYITPAEQTLEVQAQLDALIQTRVREDGDTLNPESITVLDPACGSGHILVVAYDVLKAIYLERGYQPRAIPRLILEKNLYGLDIDDRAAQMAGFALLMKARADDRRLFTATDDAGNLQPPKLNVLSLQESKGLSVDELATHLAPFKVQRATITALVDTFEHAKTFGSLIQIPYALKTYLAVLPNVLALVKQSGDMYATAAADDLLPLVQQAQVLAMQFDAVVANPPYMGNGGMCAELKTFARQTYEVAKSDLFSMFVVRSALQGKPQALCAMVTMHAWMFISTFEEFRIEILNNKSIATLAHIGFNSFPELNSKFALAAASVFFNSHLPEYVGTYVDLNNNLPTSYDKCQAFHERSEKNVFERNQSTFQRIPGVPIAYWTSDKLRCAFETNKSLDTFAVTRKGMVTADNSKYVRYWWEVSIEKMGVGFMERASANLSGKKWFPYNKGGGFRRWYGNRLDVVNWESDGHDLQTNKHPTEARVWATNFNLEYIFKPNVNWGAVCLDFSARYSYGGDLFDAGGSAAFPLEIDQFHLLAFLNSKVTSVLLAALNPTLNFQSGNIADLPVTLNGYEATSELAKKAVEISRRDWNFFEVSNEFTGLPIAGKDVIASTLNSSWLAWKACCSQAISELAGIEANVNTSFIAAYGLQDELSSESPESQITLARADREQDSQRLISNAIGCMMGRYSLDEPGLIYAHAGNVGFESGRYGTFPADADGIVPITDELWFADDAPSRICEFLRAVWGPDTLEENMAWLAESLGTKATETPDETIRRYLADKFFKDHLQTYKKRPIYWLFSSGKQGAFQALVYLHRYNESTLARLRAEYVVPLTGKIQSRIDMLQKDVFAASSTAARNKLAKEVEKLKKKHVELLAYDEQLRHHADMRITLDLDDGVKVNYGRFGNLLADVKAVTGGSSDD